MKRPKKAGPPHGIYVGFIADSNLEIDKHFASLPYDRNYGFVGRKGVIDSLEGALHSPYPGQPRVVLYGLGGVGYENQERTDLFCVRC